MSTAVEQVSIRKQVDPLRSYSLVSVIVSAAVEQVVACALVTQRARVQSPVGTSFLAEVFSGFFLTYICCSSYFLIGDHCSYFQTTGFSSFRPFSSLSGVTFCVHTMLSWSQHLTITCIVCTQKVTADRLENGRKELKPVV